MRKYILIVFFLILGLEIGIFLPKWFIGKVNAWDDCPLGEVNDEYPGECPRYEDTDNNGICDRSEPAPEDRKDTAKEENIDTKDPVISDENTEEIYSVEISGQDMKKLTIKEIADLWEIDASELLKALINEFSLQNDYSAQDTLDNLRAEYRFSPSEAKAVAESVKTGQEFDRRVTYTEDNKTSPTQKDTINKELPYNFLIPFLATTLLYLATWQLSKSDIKKKNKIFNKIGFNGFWNTILVIALIPSFVFGIVLIMRYKFNGLRDINFDFLYWHVEGSIVMGTIGILHLLTRLKQYFAQLSFIGKTVKKKSKE